MAEPKRVLLDTNIYGLLATKERSWITKLMDSQTVIIYGCKVIRDELRDTPLDKSFDSKRLRNQLLNAYDLVVGRHDLSTGDLPHYLALEYLKAYSGNISHAKLWNDFLIVAIASLKDLDVVCTEDNHSMASKLARKAFEVVNARNDLMIPGFIGFDAFKKSV